MSFSAQELLIRNVNTLAASNPGDMRPSAWKLRSSRPAPANRVTARAICAPASVHWMALRVETCVRPPCARERRVSCREPRNAGMIPHRTVAATAHVIVYSTIRQSSTISSARGRVAASVRNARDAGRPRRSPRLRPRSKARRPRRQKMQNHGCPRGPERIAHGNLMLLLRGPGEQKCSDVRARDQQQQRNGPKQDPHDCFTPPTAISLSGTTSTLSSESGGPYAPPSSDWTATISVRACSRVMPGLSLPITVNQVPDGSARMVRP